MMRMLRKTGVRTCRFLIEALSLSPKHRQNSLVAWLFVGGCIWLAADQLRGAIQPEIVVVGIYLFATLVVVCAIDAGFGIIPDSTNLVLFGGGIAQYVLTDRADLLTGVGGAMMVLFFAATFRAAFRRLRGYDGLGLGDVKFIAAATLWIGYAAVPAAILVAVASAFVAIILLNADRYDIDGRHAIPFGPHLAVGVWLIWTAGQTISFDAL